MIFHRISHAHTYQKMVREILNSRQKIKILRGFDALNEEISTGILRDGICVPKNRQKIQKNLIIISIGSNLSKNCKNPAQILKIFARRMAKNQKFFGVQISARYKNPAFGCKIPAPDFCNAVIFLRTNTNLRDFFAMMQYFERIFGRPKKHEKNFPRTLDIDVIFFKNLRAKIGEFMVPHRAAHERKSVIIPLLSGRKCP